MTDSRKSVRCLCQIIHDIIYGALDGIQNFRIFFSSPGTIDLVRGSLCFNQFFYWQQARIGSRRGSALLFSSKIDVEWNCFKLVWHVTGNVTQVGMNTIHIPLLQNFPYIHSFKDYLFPAADDHGRMAALIVEARSAKWCKSPRR